MANKKSNYRWMVESFLPQYKHNERYGVLPFQLSDNQKTSAIKLTNGFIYMNDITAPHVGLYDKQGQFLYNELEALEWAIENNNLDVIEYFDTIVPIDNERYTTYSFAAKIALRSGLDYSTQTYLMQDDSGLTKIGMSKDPSFRLTQLTKDFPSIKLVAICPYYCERELHSRFREKQVIRRLGYGNNSVEWFNLTDEDIMYICRNYNFVKHD